MRLEPILAFIVFSFVTSVTPGPNNIMLAATGANVGIRRGLPHLLGISIGFGLMQFAFIAAIGTAGTAIPELLVAMKVVGIAVLLWLAWKIATAKRASPGEGERVMGFFGAVAFQLINPKAWLICAGAVSFLQPDVSPLLQGALFGSIFAITGTPCLLLWLGFGAAMQYLLRTDRALQIYNLAMGLTLVATVPLMI